MTSSLVRFGVAMEAPLLEDFDRIVEMRGVTRSEVLRDLVRAEVAKTRIRQGAPCVASLTLVYDHHVRDLTERLTQMQHAMGDAVRSTLHIHIDEAHCLEVIILKGQADRVRSAAERLLATRGVKQGGIELIALPSLEDEPGEVHEHDGVPHRHVHGSATSKATKTTAKKSAAKKKHVGHGHAAAAPRDAHSHDHGLDHDHDHDHNHDHGHGHPHDHDHSNAQVTKRRTTTRK